MLGRFRPSICSKEYFLFYFFSCPVKPKKLRRLRLKRRSRGGMHESHPSSLHGLFLFFRHRELPESVLFLRSASLWPLLKPPDLQKKVCFPYRRKELQVFYSLPNPVYESPRYCLSRHYFLFPD